MKISDEELAAEIKAREAYGDGQGVIARAFRELREARKVVQVAKMERDEIAALEHVPADDELEQAYCDGVASVIARFKPALAAYDAVVNEPPGE